MRSEPRHAHGSVRSVGVLARALSELNTQALILDMDDTLFREVDYVKSGYTAVCRWLGPTLKVPGESLLERLHEIFRSPARSRAFDVLLNAYGRTDLIAGAVEVYRTHRPDITLTVDAAALLEDAAAQRPLAVVTDGAAVMQRAKIEALGLSRFTSTLVITDELAPGRRAWKPSPEGLTYASAALGVDAERCVYVGDNPHKDFQAARAANMSSVRFRSAFQLHSRCEAQEKYEPDLEVNRLIDVLKVLD
ncbi:HAD family hydrolase [Ornithinimicrobium sp. W1679]|uniref:HAD family hydrolase n=1 Tax=Ornithinimicrobium sp. W1679 TaxID=3418770 RepID=UPI003CEB6883